MINRTSILQILFMLLFPCICFATSFNDVQSIQIEDSQISEDIDQCISLGGGHMYYPKHSPWYYPKNNHWFHKIRHPKFDPQRYPKPPIYNPMCFPKKPPIHEPRHHPTPIPPSILLTATGIIGLLWSRTKSLKK